MSESNLPIQKNFKTTGIILCVIGVVCLIAPFIAGSAIVMTLGFLLLFGGVLYTVQGTRIGDAPGKTQHIFLGVLIIIGAILVITHPLSTMTLLTLLMAMFFIIEGIWKIVMALGAPHGSGRNSILFSGVISLLLGGLIWSQWPLSGLWAVGTLMGVDFLMTGFFLISMSGAMASSELETIETTTTQDD